MCFEAPAGQVFLEASEDAMTPFGGVVPLAAFFKKLGVLEALAQSCPLQRTSRNATHVASSGARAASIQLRS